MRGKHALHIACSVQTGITPAGAGKTPTAKAVYDAIQDHPRRCGENFYSFFKTSLTTGSPPQVRGKRDIRSDQDNRNRITPAGAGKTEESWIHPGSSRDHPRRCGENRCRRERDCDDSGSPPQVRGKLNNGSVAVILPRITPAGAGKT